MDSGTISELYDYTDATGCLRYQVVRYVPKTFRQRRPDGQGGWVWGLGDVERLLYRLPRVLAAVAANGVIYIVEGERDVHAAERAGVVATCNSGGARKWLPEHAESLCGCRLVVIVADRDPAGVEHARQVATSLEGIAEYRIVQAAIGKDLSDQLTAGLTLDQLVPFKLPQPPVQAQLRDAQFNGKERPTRADRSADPLHGIAPAIYVRLLTGTEVNSRGKCPCPLPGHDDNTPSFHAYDDPADGFYCYGCGAGGDLYSFARYLWGDGDSFPALRRRLAAALIGGVRV